MLDPMLARIASDPNYDKLRTRRLKFGWTLTIIMMIVYYGFILLVAFGKDLLATPIGSGVTTWGIPIGFGVILITIVLTGVYVLRANREYDDLTDRIKREALK
ncbi:MULTISPECIES: DUF485 domain-containing protein [unclassified Paracoccus (in: a-proteobacteria)]|uniref:DUF485 domain-containing protein n=1 Tax=unclassified Paracoccus (in: a-proteobacteria) TaxID=2688777 RepID=UPI0016004C85|nr:MULTISPECIES: DUF485 domain-containing protein [unclassified Paracoccus (in: a-proteobacteria)]MBB1491780.1 DUF485 domain-containing protein [Paracoccus sp. MC1854]MBB1496875.1 DUF485 domain-containing protein [Paracoccus sp. MC1862]QQO45500.1 DUF485 domain-containing protein [Paracoccus sp. MC1862]